MALKKRNKIDASFSMSSMTDLVFLLLVFFMVTSTMAKLDLGIKLQLPKSSMKAGKVTNTSIVIDENLTYYFVKSSGEKIEIDQQQIEPFLRDDLGQSTDEVKTFWLQADKQVPIENVVYVMNIAQRNNYKMVLATDPQ